jgi:hypothetical protein
MVALARRRVPEGDFRTASLFRAVLPRCAAVAAVGECVGYAFEAGNTAAARARLFRRIHRALLPGGLFLLDVAEPGREPRPRRHFVLQADWAVLVTASEDAGRRVLTRDITSFRKVGALYRRTHEVHRLRLLPRRRVLAELRAAGFRVRVLPGYGPLRFGRGQVAFLARKPGPTSSG